MSGSFQLKKSGEQFMFNLKATNGQVILTSERYASRQAALDGIESVRKNAVHDDRFDRLLAKDGSPYFNLKAGNGQTIGRSEMYKSTASRDAGVESVKKNGPTALLKDET